MHGNDHQHPPYTFISFDELSQTLYEAVEGVSGDTLLSRHEEGARLSYATVSRLRDGDGKIYALIQLDSHAARTVDDKTETIEQTALALIEASGCRIGELMWHLGLPVELDTAAPGYTLH